MRYRELVTVQTQTLQRSPTGAASSTWTDLIDDVPATIVASTTESTGAEFSLIADLYDIVLAGRRDVEPSMAIVDSLGRRFDVQSADYLLGGRQTHVLARLVNSPEGS